MKNNTLNLNRLVAVYRKYILEDIRVHLLRLFSYYGIMTLCFIMAAYWQAQLASDNPNFYDPKSIFITTRNVGGLFLLLTSGFTASLSFRKLETKLGRLNFLMTPGSTLEKYLATWFTTTVIFLLIFFCLWKAADYTRVAVYMTFCSNLPELSIPTSLTFEGTPFEHNPPLLVMASVIFFFFLQSCFTLGSVVVPKHSFAKTFIVLFTVGVLILYTSVSVVNKGQIYEGTQFLYVLCGLGVSFTIGNWILAYYRLKETDLI